MPVQIAANAGKPYRPSNGTEGEMFMSRNCANCTRWKDDGEGCDIALAAHVFDLDEPEYPAEWQHDAEGRPMCAAFTDQALPEPRCPHTIDLFETPEAR